MTHSDDAALRPWQVMLGGICALVLTIGIARFAYTPLLPLMQTQAGLSDAAGGWLMAPSVLQTSSAASSAVRCPAWRARSFSDRSPTTCWSS